MTTTTTTIDNNDSNHNSIITTIDQFCNNTDHHPPDINNNNQQQHVNNDTVNQSLTSRRRDQCYGVLCLIAVVILWVSSAFINQAVFTQIGFPKPLFGTCVQGSLTILFLIPIAINLHLQRRQRTLKVAQCVQKYSPSRIKLMKVRQLIRDLKPRSHKKQHQPNRTKHHLKYSRLNEESPTTTKTPENLSSRLKQNPIDVDNPDTTVIIPSPSTTVPGDGGEPSMETDGINGRDRARSSSSIGHGTSTPIRRSSRQGGPHPSHSQDRIEQQNPTEWFDGHSNQDHAPSGSSSSLEIFNDVDVHLLKQIQLLLRTATSSLPLGLAWFVAQLTFNFSLDHLSVSTTNVMSSTSTLFTLALSRWLLNESFNRILIYPVLLSFIGALLIAFNAPSTEDPSEARDSPLGLMVAICSAFLYAVFVVGLKKQQQEGESFSSEDDDEERLQQKESEQQQMTGLSRATSETCKLFGFIGVVTVCVSPLILLFAHITGIETIQLPSLEALVVLVLSGLFGTVLSNYLWALSVVLLSPIISTVGVSSQIPISVITDSYLIGGHKFNHIYILGTTFIFTGVIWVAVVSLTSVDVVVTPTDESLLRRPPRSRTKSKSRRSAKKNGFRRLPTSQDDNCHVPLPETTTTTTTYSSSPFPKTSQSSAVEDSIELTIETSLPKRTPGGDHIRNHPFPDDDDHHPHYDDQMSVSSDESIIDDDVSPYGSSGGSPSLHALPFTQIHAKEIPLFDDDSDDLGETEGL